MEIKPHPQGVELGALLLMLSETKARWLSSFLHTEFSRVSDSERPGHLQGRGVEADHESALLDRAQAEKLHQAIAAQKLMAPPLNCLSPSATSSCARGSSTSSR